MAHQIPPAVLQRILAFLTPGRFGTVTINVADGRPASLVFAENVRVSELLTGNQTPVTPIVDDS